jgi:RNA polymerase sigma-70 factor (ECF subfamily)
MAFNPSVNLLSRGATTGTRPYAVHIAATSPISDYALARAAAQGVMGAMSDLYVRYNRRVYAVCFAMTHNAAESEDLTQEVFIHLFRKIGSFRGESQFGSWLHRLTVNLVLMYFRRPAIRREQATDNPEKKCSLTTCTRNSVGGQLADKIALDSALSQLPAGCRSVFVLFEVAGYKHDEIADMLGCSVGTSKSQLHRARARLRRLLEPNWN